MDDAYMAPIFAFTIYLNFGVIMRTFVKTILIGMILTVAAQASAVIVTDLVNLKEETGDYLLLSEGESYTITHDLTDYGVPGENQVDAATLYLLFLDDLKTDRFFEKEFALVSGEGFQGQFEVGGAFLGFDLRWFDLGDEGIDDLNADGKLEVTVTALDVKHGNGDFWWKASALFADISPVAVSEPATLVLLGIGLLGLGIARRRKIN